MLAETISAHLTGRGRALSVSVFHITNPEYALDNRVRSYTHNRCLLLAIAEIDSRECDVLIIG